MPAEPNGPVLSPGATGSARSASSATPTWCRTVDLGRSACRTADMKRREFLLVAAATPFALPHLATAATARHGLVLVTADLASHIVVVDGATGRVRRRIATREAPRAIERVGRANAVSWRTRRRAS